MNATTTLLREQVDDQTASTDFPRIAPPEGIRKVGTGQKRSIGRRIVSEGTIVFLLAFGAFLTVAILVSFKYTTFSGDAFARMANGFYVLYSRDPHLAAIGFVWEPLQSVADMALLLFNHLWPPLSHNNMAGALVSSLAMAGAAYQILAALREWGVSRTPRIVLTLLFALNPMILFYGGNGMSEGLYLFTLAASTRYLLRWMQKGDLRSLAYAGVALAFSYLARNEAAAAAVAGAAAVAAVSYWRGNGTFRTRVNSAMSDVVVFAAPPFVAAAGWAITSYIITGYPFEQLSSIYGNSMQELHLPHKSFHGRVLYEVHAIGAFAPLIVIVLLAAVAVAFWRKDPRVLAPLAVLGGALGFDMLGLLHNNIENFFRYFIVTVPLQVLLVGSLVAAIQTPRIRAHEVPHDETPRAHSLGRALAAVVGVALILTVMLPATVTTGRAMLNTNIGWEETQQLGFIFHKHLDKADIRWMQRYPQELALGSYFAGIHLPNGDVVTDNSTSCVPEMITTMSQPRLWVIPNDRDFERIVADPITFHVHYILEPDPIVDGVTAMNIQYPNLWSTGAGFTKRVHEFPARGTCPGFRLFKVLRHSSTVG